MCLGGGPGFRDCIKLLKLPWIFHTQDSRVFTLRAEGSLAAEVLHCPCIHLSPEWNQTLVPHLQPRGLGHHLSISTWDSHLTGAPLFDRSWFLFTCTPTFHPSIPQLTVTCNQGSAEGNTYTNEKILRNHGTQTSVHYFFQEKDEWAKPWIGESWVTHLLLPPAPLPWGEFQKLLTWPLSQSSPSIWSTLLIQEQLTWMIIFHWAMNLSLHTFESSDYPLLSQ